MLLYRYRSIKSAVRDLKNCTFHFASKEELNDPLESYVRLYWKGDTAAWEGLLKNYICSLYTAISFYLLAGDKTLLHKNSVVFDIQAYDEVPLGRIFKEISRRFLEVKQVAWVASFYGDNNLKCGAKELTLLLRMVHELAEKKCIEDMLERVTIDREEGENLLKLIGDEPEKVIENLQKVGNESSEKKILELDETTRRRLYSDLENVMEDAIVQNMIIASGRLFQERDFLYKNDGKEKGDQARNWLSIKSNFPKIYVEQLKEFIFPESYVVCFSTANDNSAMWGNYADEHKGVCLIYESDNLRLEHKQVYHDEEGNMVRPSEFATAKVFPVEYGGNLVERNFFESLGRLTYPQVNEWLTGTERVDKDFYIVSLKSADGEIVAENIGSLYGWDTNIILEEAMGTSSVNTEVLSHIKKMYSAFEDGEIDEAEKEADFIDMLTNYHNDHTAGMRVRISRKRRGAARETNS